MCVLLLFWFITALCCGAVFIQQPMLLCVSLFFVAVSVCVAVGSMVSSLLGFMVFMVYVSGVMVLFLYMLSVYPNEMFFVKYKFLMAWSGVLILVSLSFFYCMSYSYSLVTSSGMIFDYMSLSSQCSLFVVMALMLFMVLLVVCHLCMKSLVPLRLLK